MVEDCTCNTIILLPHPSCLDSSCWIHFAWLHLVEINFVWLHLAEINFVWIHLVKSILCGYILLKSILSGFIFPNQFFLDSSCQIHFVEINFVWIHLPKSIFSGFILLNPFCLVTSCWNQFCLDSSCWNPLYLDSSCTIHFVWIRLVQSINMDSSCRNLQLYYGLKNWATDLRSKRTLRRKIKITAKKVNHVKGLFFAGSR